MALADIDCPVPEDQLHELADEALPGIRPPLTKFMRFVWAMRADLQAAYDITTAEGQKAFIWWFFVQSPSEHELAPFFTANQRAILNEPDPRVPNDTAPPVTRLMAELWHRTPDLQVVYSLSTQPGREAYVAWYFSQGLARAQTAELVNASQASLLAMPIGDPPGIPRIIHFLWYVDKNLRERFSGPTQPDFYEWLFRDGFTRFPILERIPEFQRIRSSSLPARKRRPLPFGVNLVGHARGQFGIGEDVRMAARACLAVDIPFVIHNIDAGKEVCQNDRSVDVHVNSELPYTVNIFCTTGIETARIALVHGKRLFDGRYTVGYWPWELPEWPTAWRHAFDLVDEIWAASWYAFDAYAATGAHRVRYAPPAVAVNETAGLDRRSFSLPERRFLFLFSFDALSSAARKNPFASVRAFLEAFPNGDEPVGLVMKSMRANQLPNAWKAYFEQAIADPRIYFVDRTLTRAEILDLYRVCDCFISLHRAEGFGRAIAEAMMLGKPVIATGHSGNLDFTTRDTAALVRHSRVQVGDGEYPFGEGQWWAEPDIDHASWWMRRMVNDDRLLNGMALRGKDSVTKQHHPSIVGKHYLRLLTNSH